MTNVANFSPVFSEDQNPSETVLAEEAELIRQMELAQEARDLLQNPAFAEAYRDLWNQAASQLLFTPINPSDTEKADRAIIEARRRLDTLQSVANAIATTFAQGQEVAENLRKMQNARK